MAALEQSKTYAFVFRRRYNLPPNDPRFLGLSGIDFEMDFWANRFFDHLEAHGDFPELDEFETAEIDEEIERWAEEDAEDLERITAMNRPGQWEEVASSGNAPSPVELI